MKLFSTLRLGRLELPNRIVMAPMTRSRAIGGVPNELMRDYYALRATAGLIVTEGIAPSPNGVGYARIPGIYSAEQIAGWRTVTDAVHAAGGRIFAQLMHTGRISHPNNMPAGARVLAPSAVAAVEDMWTDQAGPQPLPTPEAMTEAEIASTRGEIVAAANNAIAAGFDGIELHGANGYLLEQFLHPHTNRRTDAYGGSVENRARFVAEVVAEIASTVGADRTAIRLSPFSTFNDLKAYDEVAAQYATVARALRGIGYVHVVQNQDRGFADVAKAIAAAYEGPIMLNGGFGRATAEDALTSGRAELVSFGRPFIANPDLVARLKSDAALAEADPSTFYTPGPKGYLDYASL